MSHPTPGNAYGVLLPVKPIAVAKSRLRPLGDAVRASLVVSFALDTIDAARDSPAVARVLVVTDDFSLARELSGLGVEVIPDGASGMNGSLVQAAAELHRRYPDLRVSALCADLPALRTDELTRALAAASDHEMSFVADTERVGTTICMAPAVDRFRPRFGRASREAHLGAGAVEVDLVDMASLRRDVDTPADLAVALDLGVGRRTASVLAGLSGQVREAAGDQEWSR